MIDLAKGHPAPRYGKLLTENEHRKLMETIYIPELDKTLSKDEVLKHLRRSFGLEKTEQKLDELGGVKQ